MRKNKIFQTIAVLIFIITVSALVWIGVTQKSVFKTTSQFPLQFLVLPTCDQQNWVCKHPYPLSQSGVADIGDYRIVSYVSNTYKEELTCLDSPPLNWDNTVAAKSYIDSSDCQHWTYSEKRYQEVCDCMGCAICYPEQDYCIGIGCGVNGQTLPYPPNGCQTYTCGLEELGVFEVDYGGKRKIVDEGWGLWKRTEIYKKNKIVKDKATISTDAPEEYILIAYTNETRTASPVTFRFDDLQIILYNQEQYDLNLLTPIVLTNQYQFRIPDDSFRFSVTLPTDIYQGDNVIVKIDAENYYKPVRANLSVEYRAPSIIGEIQRIDSKIIDLPTGVSEWSYALEGRYVTENLKVTPKLTVMQPTQGLAGVNLPNPEDGKLISAEKLDYYEIGTLYGDTAVINVRSLSERIVLLERNISELQEYISGQQDYINNLDLTAKQQAEYISQLRLTVEQNSEIIKGLNNTINEQYELIQALSKNKAEQDEYVAAMLVEIQYQKDKILELQAVVDINAEIISRMNASVEEQLRIIDGLNKNVQEKNIIILELTNKISAQESKIRLMQKVVDSLGRDYASAKETILLLKSQLGSADDRIKFLLLTIEDLQLSNDEVADLLNSYESKLAEDVKLISELKLSNQDLADLIVQYKGNLDKQAELIRSLNLSNQQLNSIIEAYKREIAENQEITSKLTLSLSEAEKLIEQYKTNLLTSQELINKLGISNQELQQTLNEYESRNAELKKIIDAIQKPKRPYQMPPWLAPTGLIIGLIIATLIISRIVKTKKKRR